MKTTNLFTIDGQPVPVPDGDMSMHTEDLVSEDSGLDESGVYHRFVVRQDVKSWEFSYSRLTGEELAYLEELFAGKNTFAFGFRDLYGKLQTVTAYRSKQSVLWHSAADGTFREYRFRIVAC